MKYIKTFESFDVTNEEFFDKIKKFIKGAVVWESPEFHEMAKKSSTLSLKEIEAMWPMILKNDEATMKKIEDTSTEIGKWNSFASLLDISAGEYGKKSRTKDFKVCFQNWVNSLNEKLAEFMEENPKTEGPTGGKFTPDQAWELWKACLQEKIAGTAKDSGGWPTLVIPTDVKRNFTNCNFTSIDGKLALVKWEKANTGWSNSLTGGSMGGALS